MLTFQPHKSVIQTKIPSSMMHAILLAMGLSFIPGHSIFMHGS
ncbi:hypothetical protein V473_16050 [Sphingobium cupriresistens LL01]|uniref:Uncharacterized protein n=1 Tax=Sphingobium cupriresistens LL01 TaxID=1420583 RepID=A0A0J7XR49_9SPHN|nr:hypothetical protein V473_16050 [Sphingobium cupriresistens LL01]